MTKKSKTKNLKSAGKRSKGVEEPELPSLVMAMAKLVERMESVERKVDQVLGCVSNLQAQRPQVSQPQSSQALIPRPSPRVMYQVVCADCHKNTEVPFKPGDRPVYCKECFTIRKSGHAPQDPDRRIPMSEQKKPSYVPSALSDKAIPTIAGNTSVFTATKQKSAKNKTAQWKKKKK